MIKIVDNYLLDNNQLIRNGAVVASKFIENNADPLNSELIRDAYEAAATLEGANRTVNALKDVTLRLKILADLYKEKNDTDSDWEYSSKYLSQGWINHISEQFYNSAIYEAGTSLQRIQLLRGLDILTDDFFDLDAISDEKFFSFLESQYNKLTTLLEENLSIKLALKLTKEEKNSFFSETLGVYVEARKATAVLNKKKLDNKSYSNTEDEDRIEVAEKLIRSFITSVFLEYSKKVFKLPQRLQTFSLLAKVKPLLEIAEQEASKASEQYLEVMQRLDDAGYSMSYDGVISRQ